MSLEKKNRDSVIHRAKRRETKKTVFKRKQRGRRLSKLRKGLTPEILRGNMRNAKKMKMLECRGRRDGGDSGEEDRMRSITSVEEEGNEEQ